MRRYLLPGLGLALAASLFAAEGRKTRNVVFVMADGLRWQEVFSGADKELLNKKAGGVSDVNGLTREFWRDSAGARRQALLPFLWDRVAREGQIYGNRELGSDAYVTNGLNFSYPGYSEVLCGFADPRVNSNDKKPNPNVSVLEWLHGKPEYAGKVAAFGAWDLFPYILNAQRSGLLVNAGYDPLTLAPAVPVIEVLNRVKVDTGVFGGEPMDGATFHTAVEYLKLRRPRVLFLSLGEPDEWAHDGRYDLYLRSIHRFDGFVRELWETLQSMPEYRDSTTLILGADHGRGRAPKGWRSHGRKLPESRYVWMAFLGPDTRAAGERSRVPPVTENQVAATLAAFLGEDYSAAVTKAGRPIADALPR